MAARGRTPSDGPSAARARVRACAACQKPGEPDELVRWVLGPDGHVVPDLGARAFGRGAWLHPAPDCLRKAQSALSRSFRTQVLTSAEEAVQLLSEAAGVQVGRLLGQAKRQGLLSEGGTLTEEAYQEGRASAILVAADAGRATLKPWLERAIEAGRARIWGTKDELGRFWGRPEVAVLGILDQRLAKRVFGGIAMALLAPEQVSRGKRIETSDRGLATEDE